MFKYDENKILEGLRKISQIKPGSRSTGQAVEKIRRTLTAEIQIDSNAGIWRIIMRSPITKLAAAACVFIAVVAGIYLLTGKTPNVTCCAWAKIGDKVCNIYTCIYREYYLDPNNPTSGPRPGYDTMHYLSSQYGYRMDSYDANGKSTYTNFLLSDEKLLLHIYPAYKRWERLKLKDRDVVSFRMNFKDPRYLLNRYLQDNYIELGESIIDGIKVKGIEVNHPEVYCMYDDVKVRTWVDIETQLPVRYEMELKLFPESPSSTMIWDNFQWGVPLTKELFEPNIPDYYPLTESILPGQDETAAIESLRKIVELADGNFPSRPNGPTIRKEIRPGLEKKYFHYDYRPWTKEELQAKRDEASQVQGFIDFYMKLAMDGNEPAYYGKDVKAGDANAVLMTWKISDDIYRVIYGDLSVENISAQQLKEMEQPAKE